MALIVAGCAAPAADPGVASAGASPTASADSNIVAAYVDGVRQWVACMRAAGIEVSDPDAKGHTEISGDLGLLKKDPAFLAASEKCSPLRPPVPKELQERLVLTPEQLETAKKYADCMQSNGAPDFPDPGPDGYPVDSRGDVTWDQASDGAQRASRVCGPIVGAPATPGPGQG